MLPASHRPAYFGALGSLGRRKVGNLLIGTAKEGERSRWVLGFKACTKDSKSTR